jgi:hypothetical protein
MALGPSRGRLTSDICHPIPALQIVNHDKSIIVSSLSMPLRLLGEVGSLLHHVSRPMKLVRIDPFACVAKHETTAARRPRNRAQPVRQSGPPHLDTRPPRPHRRDAHVHQFRLCAPRSPQGPKPRHQPGWRSCSLPAICCVAAEHANNWYHPSAESRRDVPQGYSGVRSIQVTIG